MRNMAFSMTTPQVKARTKTVTRRFGWVGVENGDLLCAVEKGQGIPKGGHVVRICVIEVVSHRWEPLNAITKRDVIAEGFPDLTPDEFVRMFADPKHLAYDVPVNRIEFKYGDIQCKNCQWQGWDDADTPEGGLLKIYKGDKGWDAYDPIEDPDDDGVWVCPKCYLPEDSGIMSI